MRLPQNVLALCDNLGPGDRSCRVSAVPPEQTCMTVEPSSPAGLRLTLKAATAELHAEAETVLDWRYGTSGDMGRFLSCMLRGHRYFAQPCDRASLLVGIPVRSARLVAALAGDCRIDDLTTVGNETQPSIKNGWNDSYCLGVGYVFEGSAMGAHVLSKCLRDSSKTVPDYLHLLTEEAQSRWPRFVERLDKGGDAGAAVDGASRVFRFLTTHAKG